MDRLEAMAILVRVSDRGSFSAAARELGAPLATVSRKVGELEAQLGVRMLARTTRKVELTEAGAAYVASARRILDQVAEAEKAAAGEFSAPRGELTITAPLLFGRLYVLPIVAEFLALWPEITVRLLLSDRNLHLLEDHVDLAVRIGPLADSALLATRIGSMRLVTCAAPSLLETYGEPESPQDLASFPIVSFDFLSTWGFRAVQAKRQMEVPIQARLTVTTAEAAVWAAVRAVGLTRVLHYQCIDAVSRGDLKIVLADFEREPLPVHLVRMERGPLPPKLRLFLDFASPRLRNAITEPG